MAGPNIQKLNSTNYQNWSSDIKYILSREKPLGHFWIEVKKAPIKDPGGTNAAEMEAYQVRADQVLSILYLNVELEFDWRDWLKVIMILFLLGKDWKWATALTLILITWRYFLN